MDIFHHDDDDTPTDDEEDLEGEEFGEEDTEGLGADVYLKFVLDGASTLTEVVAGLRSLAADLEARQAEGWAMTEPVDGGHIRMLAPSAGDAQSA